MIKQLIAYNSRISTITSFSKMHVDILNAETQKPISMYLLHIFDHKCRTRIFLYCILFVRSYHLILTTTLLWYVSTIIVISFFFIFVLLLLFLILRNICCTNLIENGECKGVCGQPEVSYIVFNTCINI